jgi:hypothetical protein
MLRVETPNGCKAPLHSFCVCRCAKAQPLLVTWCDDIAGKSVHKQHRSVALTLQVQLERGYQHGAAAGVGAMLRPG